MYSPMEQEVWSSIVDLVLSNTVLTNRLPFATTANFFDKSCVALMRNVVKKGPVIRPALA